MVGMKVLMTGANGFLGIRLVRTLATRGVQVRAIVRKRDGNPALVHPNIELVEGDFSVLSVLEDALQGISQVYHLAAISNDWSLDSRDFYKVNVDATLQLIEVSRRAGVEKILITSTAGTIGPPDPDHLVPVSENHVRHVRFFTDYECSKILMEERVQHYVKAGMHIVLVNPTRIFGPGPIERKNPYLILIRSYLHRTFAPYPAFKTQLGNMAYIDDVVEGHLLAMEKGRSGERYLLGGSNVTFGDLFKTLTKITGHQGRPIAVPIFVFRLLASIFKLRARWFKKTPFLTHAWIDKSLYSWPVSSEKAVQELGYQISDYETALRRCISFIDDEIKAGRA
jgi:nucleoside-diphosphate-sugar epimerase